MYERQGHSRKGGKPFSSITKTHNRQHCEQNQTLSVFIFAKADNALSLEVFKSTIGEG